MVLGLYCSIRLFGRCCQFSAFELGLGEKTKREKSQKYAGVYFRRDADRKERTYYIVYRQGGREAKLIEKPVGKASAAWQKQRLRKYGRTEYVARNNPTQKKERPTQKADRLRKIVRR